MITRFSFFVTVGLIAISCGSKERDTQTYNISGVYVREYSFKVIHPERGDTIGVRTIRDTIFIGQKNQYYEVSNRKWRLNDYDKEGWKSMEHDDDRPTVIARQAVRELQRPVDDRDQRPDEKPEPAVVDQL